MQAARKEVLGLARSEADDGKRLKRDYPRFLNGKSYFTRTMIEGVLSVAFLDEYFPTDWIDSGVLVIFDFNGDGEEEYPEEEKPLARRFRPHRRGTAGIGKRLAQVAAAAGAKVVLVARGRARLEAVRDEIEAAGGDACIAVADVTDCEAMIRAFETAEDRFGVVDLFVATLACSSGKGR